MTVSFLPTLSTINPSSKQREVIFGKTGTPKFAGQYPIPRIPILSLIGAISSKTFKKLFNFDLLFKIGIFSIL